MNTIDCVIKKGLERKMSEFQDGAGDSKGKRAAEKTRAQTRLKVARLFISNLHVMHFSIESIPASASGLA
jgi:hypothetical protein